MKSLCAVGLLCLIWAGAVAAQDVTPPAAVDDVAVVTGKTTAVVTWHNTGDDGHSGTATTYEVRRATNSLPSDWTAADLVSTGTPVGGDGTQECKDFEGLSCNTVYYWAVFLLDEVANRSDVSNVVQRNTQSCDSILEYACN